MATSEKNELYILNCITKNSILNRILSVYTYRLKWDYPLFKPLSRKIFNRTLFVWLYKYVVLSIPYFYLIK